jgi:NDP-sugar pyrophosphorylase family protein
MKAMIFTTGLRNKLLPQPAEKPGALVEINGEPLIGMLIKRLADSGFTEIILNVHHFAGPIIDFLKKKKFFGIRIEISDETELTLDTGGIIRKVGWFFNDPSPFLIYNLEILSDINLIKLYSDHTNSGAMATLVVRKRESPRYMLFNKKMQLCGWKNNLTRETRASLPYRHKLSEFAFSRIQIVNPLIFEYLTFRGDFSLVDIYLRLASEHHIRGYLDNDSIWMDLGKKEGIVEAERFFQMN